MGTKKKYIKGIDGLRALAVIMVLAYHLKMPFARSGLLGVTVFFVISGYLITGILVSEIEENGSIDLKNFWVRRIRRLLPAVLSMAVVMIFVSAIVNRVVFTKGCNDLLSAVFGYNNWWQIFRKVSYFENAGAPSPFTHCWSLAIETQFYLVYPLLLILLSKVKNRGKVYVAVTTVLVLISAVLMAVLYNPAGDPSRVYYGTDTRAFSLLIGALAALQKEYKVIKVRIRRNIWAVAGSVALVILMGMMIVISSYSSFLYYGGQVLISVLAAVVVYAVTVSKSPLSTILGSSILKWIGDRSYSIYLWHYPIIVLMSGGKKAVWWIVLLELSLSVGLAELSYRFIETPIRHGIIKEYITIINTKPHSRRERHRQVQVARNSVRAMGLTVLVGIALVLCIAFVPKKATLDTVAKREKKATEVSKLTNQKLKEQKANAKQSSKDESKGKSTETMTDKELLDNVKILLIGDSITVDVTEDYYKVFPRGISDTKIGRSTLTGVKVFEKYLTQEKWDGDGVIFALGTNGPMYDTLASIRQKAGKKPLFLTTVHAPKEDFESSNNKEIRDFVKNNKHTYLIDWYTASENHPEYFDQDDTHLLPKGAKAYAECIKKAVLDAMRKENF